MAGPSAIKLDCDSQSDISTAGHTRYSESRVPRIRSWKPKWLSVNFSPLAPGIASATCLQDGRCGFIVYDGIFTNGIQLSFSKYSVTQPSQTIAASIQRFPENANWNFL